MKKFLISLALLMTLSLNQIKAASNTFTKSDVALHNTQSDCYVIFENTVYDLTSYIKLHDRYLDIREWCGNDMTQAFKTKDGTNRDHKSSSYSLLENYKIGTLSADVTATSTVKLNPTTNSISTTPTIINTSENTEPTAIKNPYTLLPLVLITGVLYWGWYFLTKKGIKSKIFTLPVFNMFWNSVLLITLIPSFFFGVFMVLQYSIPSLNDINFNFIYWHVEGSIIMGTVALCHFINRIRQYFFQMKFIGSPQS